MTDDKFIVDGFRFKTNAEAVEAKNEYDGVQYMKSRTNMNNPANVYAVYKSIIEKKLFKTPVGMKYLWELREVLYESGMYDEKELDALAIPVPEKEGKKVRKSRKKKKEKVELSRRDVIRNMKNYDIESVYRNRFINAIILNVILIIAIILIIVIANNSDNTNILNYKNRIDAQYQEREDALVQWKQELDIREAVIKQRENELENEPTVD